MAEDKKQRKVHYGKIVVLIFTLYLANICYGIAYATEPGLPEEVCVVRNEVMMINRMMKGMRKHQAEFHFYYPGIGEDFRKYQKESSYKAFMEKLAKKDGYQTGIVSGYCITVQGMEKKYVTFQFCYLTTRRQERSIDRRVKKIVKQIGSGSVALRAKRAHDYLLQHMQYDKRYYNPYDAFSKGKGLCMSYALAYQRILQEMKIPCIYVKGWNHAWNMVRIGDRWYNVDVTWDDTASGSYRYFLKADKDFQGHIRPESDWLLSRKMARDSYDLNKIR